VAISVVKIKVSVTNKDPLNLALGKSNVFSRKFVAAKETKSNDKAPILFYPKNKQISPLKFHLTSPRHVEVFQL
jgi:hypothetical protein